MAKYLRILPYIPKLTIESLGPCTGAPHSNHVNKLIKNIGKTFSHRNMQSSLRCGSSNSAFLQRPPPVRRSQSTQKRSCRHQTLAMKTDSGPSVAIVGVSGAVGQEFLRASQLRTIIPHEMICK